MTIRRPVCHFVVTTLLVAFSLNVQVLSGLAQVNTNSSTRLPVTLSLKDKSMSPIDPRKVFPEINYRVAVDMTVSCATWVFSIQKGLQRDILGVSFYPSHERKEEVQIFLSNKTGTLTWKDGDMQKFLSMWITYSKIQGEGTMGIALIDFNEWQEKGSQARQLSNVLEFPVKLSN